MKVELIGGPLCGNRALVPDNLCMVDGTPVAGNQQGVYRLEIGGLTAVWRFLDGMAV